MDRRQVLIGLALFSIVAGGVLVVLPYATWPWLAIGFAFGAGLLPCYAIAAAHIFDFADRADYVEVSAGLLLINGIGSSIGPLLASLSFELIGPAGIFVTNGLVFAGLVAFVAVRLARREGLPEEEKHNFDLGTSAAVSVVADEEAIQLSDLVIEDPIEAQSEPADPVP